MIKIKRKSHHKVIFLVTYILITFLTLTMICYAKSSDGSFKSYMNYKKITDKTSEQYELQQIAYTDSFGFRRIIKSDDEIANEEEDYYCVAMGNYYANYVCGKKFHIILDSEIEFDIIICDIKKDKDTDSENRVCVHNGSIIEFIVDVNSISEKSKIDGTMHEFDGSIISIEEIVE